jgi:uncharacterized radical SAM protein YgiQ
MFLPTTAAEVKRLGWEHLDAILVSGDSYIDSPYSGIAVIGKVLTKAGFRVGIIAQPTIHSAEDITRLGEPTLFWGVSGGTVDSMVANYTALNKKRKSDDFTPGGVNNRRPDRAVIAYANLIRRYFKQTAPIVLGGIEASLRRVAHYDYWVDGIRRSILLDAKADFLLYGMAEKSVLELAQALKNNTDPYVIRGLCYISKKKPKEYIELPSFEEVRLEKKAFMRMFHLFYQNNDPLNALGLAQKHQERFLVQNPPAYHLTQSDLDDIYRLDYERAQHPYYEQQGKVKALETIRFSIPTHRGCYGECNFCAIAVHEGRTVRWRSQESILEEAKKLSILPDFKGYILDVSGPTANMYGIECGNKNSRGSCKDKRCLYPDICPLLKQDHSAQIELLKKIRQIHGIKKVFVASGIRYDMVLNDRDYGQAYLQELVEHHVSGQLKVAPEHTQTRILALMGKPGIEDLNAFKRRFDQISFSLGKPQFLTYYLIAAYPGCSEDDMDELKVYVSKQLQIIPEQVQVFTPTPSTYASLMYYTEMDPFSGEPIFVEKNLAKKQHQKDILTAKNIYAQTSRSRK